MELSRRSFLKRGLVFGGGAVGAASGTAGTEETLQAA